MSADDWPTAGDMAQSDPSPEQILDEPDLERADSARALFESSYAGGTVRRAAGEISAATALGQVSGPIRYFTIFAGDAAMDAAEAIAALATDRLDGPVVITQHLDHATGWLGINDCVLIISNSGTDEQSIAAARLAHQRGAMLIVSTARDCALATMCAFDRRAIVLSLGDRTTQPFWAHLAVGQALICQLCGAQDDGLFALADSLDQVTALNGPVVATAQNSAKSLAVDCLTATPLAISDSPLAAAAAYHFSVSMLALQGIPVAHVLLPSGLAAVRSALEGPFVAAAEDIFFDPFQDAAPTGPNRPLQLVMFCESTDDSSHTILTREAADRGVALTLIDAQGSDRAQRLASLVQLSDMATGYLSILGAARRQSAS